MRAVHFVESADSANPARNAPLRRTIQDPNRGGAKPRTVDSLTPRRTLAPVRGRGPDALCERILMSSRIRLCSRQTYKFS